MKKLLQTVTLSSCLTMAFSAVAFAQTAGGAAPVASPSPSAGGVTANQIVGEVTAVDQASNAMMVRADGGGGAVIVLLTDKTAYYRAKSDAMQRAETAKITPADLNKVVLSDIGVGDRVVVLGKVADDKKSVPARVVIATTKAEIAVKHETDREQWRSRGIVGTITAVNPETKEVTVNVRSREGMNPVVVVAGGEKILFRRYAPDSVKFADAKPGTFTELKAGDQLRALGERSPDGARFTPAEIVSGSFQQLLGTVVSVSPETNEVKITGVQDKKPFTVVVRADTQLKRLPPQIGMM
ncbi:MAG: hypothetical protein ACRD9R_14755, partial [Pyrinomonadaceae bacterium]